MKTVSQKTEIKKLTLSDIPQILEIETASFSHPWSINSFRTSLINDVFTCIGIFEKRLAGYLITINTIDELHILNIAVKPELRKRGYAAAMMKYIMELFADSVKYIWLEVRVSNQTAIDFYRKFGFQTVSTRSSYYPDGEDALLMTANLKE